MKTVSSFSLKLLLTLALLCLVGWLYFSYMPSRITSERKHVVTVTGIGNYARGYNDYFLLDFSLNRKYRDAVHTDEMDSSAILTTPYTRLYRLDENQDRVRTTLDRVKPGDSLEVWASSTTTFGGEIIEAVEITVLK